MTDNNMFAQITPEYHYRCLKREVERGRMKDSHGYFSSFTQITPQYHYQCLKRELDRNQFNYSSSLQRNQTHLPRQDFQIRRAPQASQINSPATQAPPQPPAPKAPTALPEFDRPWREVDWSENHKKLLLGKLNKFRPAVEEISYLRILLHGPIGAGKSSFINSVNMAIRGQNAAGALAASGSGKSFTSQFRICRLKKEQPRSQYPFVFSDVMGLEPGSSQGVHTDDIISILKGHVKDGYSFNPVRPLENTNANYIRNPTFKDKIHCLVSVLPADKISLMSDEVMQKMKIIRERARHMDIPQVVIMSMPDKVCPLVAQDVKKIYTSKKVKEKMQECSDKSGVPMNCIFPVKNYSEQVTSDFQMDILILMAVKDIIMFADDYVEDQIYREQGY